jgi:C-terminal processing protease CtpA/Prc
VAVLIGPSTYSAAEDFLAVCRASGRGITIGLQTGGSTGQPLMFPLPGEGMGIVCSKRDLMSGWTEFAGYGIRPDVAVNYTYANFINGRDEAIAEAVRYFGK